MKNKWYNNIKSVDILKIGIILITYVFILLNIKYIREQFNKIGIILTPFIFGFVIAYLINPVVVWVRRLLYMIFKRDFKNKVCMIIAYIIVLVILAFIMINILPQIWRSIDVIIKEIPSALDKGYAWVDQIGIPYITEVTYGYIDLSHFIEDLSTNLDVLFAQIYNGIGKVAEILFGFGRFVFNFILGCLISMYMLVNKQKYKGQLKKAVFAFFNKDTAEKFLEFWYSVNKTFSNFLLARIIDSIIIGVICYISCIIIGFENALLISFIVGVTNVIPYFGPFLGAIPCALIVLLQGPFYMLLFLFFILLLQQFDGNILGPRLLGDSLGLTSLWIIFAVIIMTAMFGVIGMVIGVPLFAIVYMLIKDMIDRKLEARGLSVDTDMYINHEYWETGAYEFISLKKEKDRIKNEEK